MNITTNSNNNNFLMIIAIILIFNCLYLISASPSPSTNNVFDKINALRKSHHREPTSSSEVTSKNYPKRILFIGNSMTYVGNLPKLITQIAAEHHFDSISVDSVTPGGTTLQQHYDKGIATKKIQSGNYDIVVIQGQSSEAIDDYENFKTYGIKLANEAIKYKAKPFLFSAWSCCTPFACSGEQQQEDYEAISKAYEDISKATKATIVPVGKSWQLYRKAHPKKVGELTSDNCHPNQDGAYLSACVFFETIFAGTSSVGTNFHGNVQMENIAKELQATAHSAVTFNIKK